MDARALSSREDLGWRRLASGSRRLPQLIMQLTYRNPIEVFAEAEVLMSFGDAAPLGIRTSWFDGHALFRAVPIGPLLGVALG